MLCRTLRMGRHLVAAGRSVSGSNRQCMIPSRSLNSTATSEEENAPNTDTTSPEPDTEDIGPSDQFLSTLSESQLAKLNTAKEEFQVLRYVDDKLPSAITDEQWEALMETPHQAVRLKYLGYLHRKEEYKRRDSEGRLAAEAAGMDEDGLTEQVRKEYRERAERGEIVYKPGHNTLFTKYQKNRMWPVYYSRMFLNQQAGACPRVIFDMSFLSDTFESVRSLSLRQLALCYTLNRSQRLPFELVLTGVPLESKWWHRALNSQLMSFNYDVRTYPCLETQITSKCYTQLFPKEELVYLSSYSPYTMSKYDANKTYIIGGFVGKYDTNLPGSAGLARAKEKGITCERLPLHRFAKWERGNRQLTLNAQLKMLLKVHEWNDWRRAVLASVPARKFTKTNERNRQRNREYRQSETFRLSLLQESRH